MSGFSILRRIKKLCQLMDESDINAVLITNKNDIYYYTGIYLPKNENGFLVLTREDKTPMLFIPSLLELKQKKKKCRIFHWEKPEDIKRDIPEGRIGIDEYSLSAHNLRKLKKPKTKWIFFSEKIKEPRMYKDEYELECIKKAVKITESIFKNLEIQGKTEEKIAKEIKMMLGEQDTEPAFEPIVASGINSATVHHIPERKRVLKRDMVIVDFGARFRGYCSDITRTFCMSPGKKEKQIYEDVLEIQGELMETLKKDIQVREIQKIYENLLKKKGYKPLHSFGHGIGLDVHERPGMKDTLKNNMVLTVEPGVYVKGLGGCRIEDMIIIKNKAKPISTLSRIL